jgi:tetratricopeptide (TPR) repeat protein
MEAMRYPLTYVIILLLICGGKIAPCEARSSSAMGPADAPKKTQGATGGMIQSGERPRIGGEFPSAPTLFRQGRFAEAERQFAWIAKVRHGTTWGERGQYYLAECQYRQKKYVTALDSYERLHVDYPATAYKDDLIRREYEIAQIWLAQTNPLAPADKQLPWTARFDGRIPLLDCGGSALKALEHVLQNGPDGPLADDAAIQIADYHMKQHRYDLAALYYDQFVAGYCRSQFQVRAQLGAIDARIRCYLESFVKSGSSARRRGTQPRK